MHQTSKAKQWSFGMKVNVGVASKTKLIHSVSATTANVHDSQVLGDLLHGGESRVWGHSAYAGQTGVIRHRTPQAKDFTQKRGSRYRPLSELDRRRNRTKSRVRAKAEYSLLIFKRVFGSNKVRYPGIDKNATRLFVACGLVNLCISRKLLLKPP